MKFADALHIAYPSLDRFAQGPADTVGDEPQAWAVCEMCRREIFPGDSYYDVEGIICCDDVGCALEAAGAKLKEAGVA